MTCIAYSSLSCPNGEVQIIDSNSALLTCGLSLRLTASLRDRSSLLGAQPASGRSSPFNEPYSQPNGHRFTEDLESQNDEALEGLSAKVKLLKDVRRNDRYHPLSLTNAFFRSLLGSAMK